MLLLASSAMAQNTKGDKPAGKTRQARDTRFKMKSRQGDRAKTKDIAGRRLRTKNKSSANRANASYKQPSTARKSPRYGKERASKPIRPIYNSRPSNEQRAWKGNAGGQRIKVRSSTGRTRNVYPQRNPYVNNASRTPKDAQQRMRAVTTPRVKVRSSTGKTRNVYPQNWQYSHNPSRKPRSYQPRASNNRQLKQLRRSSSRAYISHRSINAFAGFWNKKKKGERAYVGDITGRRLRTKNYETRPPSQTPAANPYYGRKRVGDRPYKGPAGGGYMSRTQAGKAWRGDITGRKVRGRNFSSKKSTEVSGRPVSPPRKSKRGAFSMGVSGRKLSVSGKRKTQLQPNPVKTPGIGANRIGTYQGNMRMGKTIRNQGEGFSGTFKSRRPLKGGGSRSGFWNNKGSAISGRYPGKSATMIGTWRGNQRSGKILRNQGEEYTGSVRARRPFKGGGSVSGKLWNNKNTPVSGRYPGKAAMQMGVWQGDRKGYRPLKGGGSVSGRLWNNKNKPVTGRYPGKAAVQMGVWQGDRKGSRPLKGGGSVSGRLWNNKNTPLTGRYPGKAAIQMGVWRGDLRTGKVMRNQGEEYTGSIRARKPLKGGGSVSGKLWNNKQKPLNGRYPGKAALQMGVYRGNLRMPQKVMRNQGEEYTGHLKARKPLKGGGSVSGKLWNNKEKPINGKAPGRNAEMIEGFPGKLRQFDLKPSMRNQGEEYTGNIRHPRFRKAYVKNPNSAEESLRKKRPDKTTFLVDDLQVRVKQKEYKTRPYASANAMKGIGPTKSSIKASEYSRGLKLNWRYQHNPSSSKDALKTREPGRAFARATDYQGNIRMKKFNLFGRTKLHPDAQFVKINKNNVKEERDFFTNFKLWWARLFRKNETQPEHLKEKYRKPRYDKREQGLWYD
jgi:hypothetical protein